MDGRDGLKLAERRRSRRFSAKLEAAPPRVDASSHLFPTRRQLRGTSPAWTHTLTPEKRRPVAARAIKDPIKGCNPGELPGADLEVRGRTNLLAGRESGVASATASASQRKVVETSTSCESDGADVSDGRHPAVVSRALPCSRRQASSPRPRVRPLCGESLFQSWRQENDHLPLKND